MNSTGVKKSPFSILYEIVDCKVREVASGLVLIVQQVAAKIWEIYKDSGRVVPPVVPPPHPLPNTYLRCKKLDWPQGLDNAAGNISGADPEDVNGIANLRAAIELATPLHSVGLGKNFNAVRVLIGQGGDVDALDFRGQSPAYWAAYHGNLKILTMLTAYGATLHNKDYRGKTCLRAAVKYGREEVVEFLAAKQVDLDVRDGRGLTPLHLAAYKGNFAMYKLLILLGADSTLLDPKDKRAEDILWNKYEELYYNRNFFFRLFTRRTPPPIPFSEEEIAKFAAARKKGKNAAQVIPEPK